HRRREPHSRRLLQLLVRRGDVVLDLLLEEVERESAVAQDDVVEVADVEFGAELLFGLRAQVADFELADLVGKALAGPGNVAIDFSDGLIRNVQLEESNGAVAIPALRVHPGIDDEADGAETFATELAEA